MIVADRIRRTHVTHHDHDAGAPTAGMPSSTAAAGPPASVPSCRACQASPPAGAPHPQRRPVGDQVVRGGAGHRGGHHVAGARARAGRREVDEPVVPGPPGHPVGRRRLCAPRPPRPAPRPGGRSAPRSRPARSRRRARPAARSVRPPPPAGPGPSMVGGGRARPGRVLERERPGEPGLRGPRRGCRRSRASVSPGKPTMMSVVMAASGIAARTRSRIRRYFSRR